MIKTYKHKTLGWIAKLSETDNKLYYVEGHYGVISKDIIKNSNDWELMPEKDYIDNITESLNMDLVINRGKTGEEILRRAIEKHIPSISVEEIRGCNVDSEDKESLCLCFEELLKEKGLLS